MPDIIQHLPKLVSISHPWPMIMSYLKPEITNIQRRQV